VLVVEVEEDVWVALLVVVVVETPPVVVVVAGAQTLSAAPAASEVVFMTGVVLTGFQMILGTVAMKVPRPAKNTAPRVGLVVLTLSERAMLLGGADPGVQTYSQESKMALAVVLAIAIV